LKIIRKILFWGFFANLNSQITIMIDPAGDAKNVGRKIVESYERTITFKMAESLRQKIAEKYNFKIVFTRNPGEEVFDLQKASFANRLNVDFYLSLHIYRHEFAKPKVFVYNLVYNPVVDFANRSLDPYKFIPISQSHYLNINKTQLFGRSIRDYLSQEIFKNKFDFYGVYGIPIKSLVGVIAPALAIEVGICNEEQWKFLVDPIVDSLNFLNR